MYTSMFKNTEKSKISKQFLTLYFTFLDFLKTFIYSDEKLKLFNYFYNKNLLLKKANPSFFIKKWYESITVNYYKEILEDNIDFFLNKDDYDVEIKSNLNNPILNQLRIKERIVDCIEDFKELDETKKNELINYIKNLTLISILYFKK